MEDSDHAAVVAQELYLASGSMGSPKVSSNNEREKRQEGNRLWRRKKRPETKKNQWERQMAPKPVEPAASDAKKRSGSRAIKHTA